MPERNIFEELHELDKPDTSSEEFDELLASLRASRQSRRSRSSRLNNRRGHVHVPPQIQQLTRTVSEPLVLASKPKALVKEPSLNPSPITADTKASDPLIIKTSGVKARSRGRPPKVPGEPPSEMSTVGKGKRKRGQSLDMLPESEQIFQGLRFYFLPNDDVAPSRKLRIRRALERGAKWVKQWNDGITHIIVENHLTFDDLLKYLKVSSLPPTIVVVNELYPAECISYKILLNPDQRIYFVSGYHPKVPPVQDESTIDSSEASLPLKPEKSIADQPSPTPTHDEASEQGSANHSLFAEMAARPQAKTTGLPPSKPSNRSPDALDQAIEETLAIKDLPLDGDDEEILTSSMHSEDSDDNSSSDERMEKKAQKPASKPSWRSKFPCMDTHTGVKNEHNPNARTISILQQMATYYSSIQDHWRTISYRKAIAALSKQPHRITSKDAALAIPSIGDRLAAKVEEIVTTDRLRRLENAVSDPTDRALQCFLGIYGVGHTQAIHWINQGHRSLDDLLAKTTLTRNQRVGIDHYDDFAARIPRAEVERHARIVRDAIEREDDGIEVIVGGSYRRGAQDSGDVDFIITPKPERGGRSIDTLRTVIFETVIPKLFGANYLKCTLASPHTAQDGGSKWHGAASLPSSPSSNNNKWRRIDFLLVPEEERGAAMIYFTGNDIFNRSIRLLARKKGYRLNQRGLWRDVIREGWAPDRGGKGGGKGTRGMLVEGRNERRIFEKLGVPWREPGERIC